MMQALAFGPALLIASDQQTNPRWIQIAVAGTYHGERGGVSLTSEMFARVVANFRCHPQYRRGRDGIGNARVVPFDYEHASEMPPTSGSIPTTGAPAPGWVLELDVRGNGSELWALSWLNDRALEQVASAEYRFTSVAIAPDVVDPVSGVRLGPVLTSVALTNHPLIQSMQPIAASMNASGGFFYSGAPPMNNNNTLTLQTLSAYPGRNRTEKAIAFLTQHQPGFKNLDRQEQCLRAGQFHRALPSGAPAFQMGARDPSMMHMPHVSSFLPPVGGNPAPATFAVPPADQESAEVKALREALEGMKEKIEAARVKAPQEYAQLVAKSFPPPDMQQAQASLGVHDLRAYPGRNLTEKAIAYLCQDANFAALDHSMRCFHAGQWLRSGVQVLA